MSDDLTRCIEDGCEYSVGHIEAVDGGYRLTCGEHAGEDAVSLAAIDLRKYGGERGSP